MTRSFCSTKRTKTTIVCLHNMIDALVLYQASDLASFNCLDRSSTYRANNRGDNTYPKT